MAPLPREQWEGGQWAQAANASAALATPTDHSPYSLAIRSPEIPQDIALVCFDDIDYASRFDPFPAVT
jgi:hypothetical protein